MIRLIIISLTFFLVSCGTQKKEAERLALQPHWVKTTPMLDNYYVGISSVKKLGTSAQYIRKAKQQALANMAESISSNVSSKSVLQTIENKYGHSDYFNQTIEINSDEYIAGFEVENTYEDVYDYWIYYKISHSKYAEMKRIRKEKALNLALLKYEEARNLLGSRKIVESLNFMLQGLKILKPYLKEENIILYRGKSIDIANITHTLAINTIKQFSIRSNKTNLRLKNNTYIPYDFMFMVKHKGIAIGNIPVKIKYSGSYLKNENLNSKFDGSINIVSEKISSHKNEEELMAIVDIKKIIQNICDDIAIRSLMPIRENISVKIPVYITKESVNLNISQRSNSVQEKKYILSIFKQIAVENRYDITRKSKSDYSVSLVYRYDQGETVGSLTSCYLQANIFVYDGEKREIWSKEISRIKSVGKNKSQIKAKAFESFKQNLKVRYFKQAFDIIKQNKL